MRRPLPRSSPVVCLLSCLLAGCASSTETMVVSVNPAEASVYINGGRRGQGGRRPHELDFGPQQRVYVQATAPGYEPHFEWFTAAQIKDMQQHDLDLAITLRQRR